MRERRTRERSEALEGYGGLLGRTRRAPVLLSEEDGGAEVRWVYRGVNAATDPALAELARRGELLRVDRAGGLELSFVYHDPSIRKFALVVPGGLRHRVLAERAALLDSLASEPEHAIPAYVASARVVVGLEGLARYLDEAPDAPLDEARAEAPPPSPRGPATLPAGEDPFEELDELTPATLEDELRRLVESGPAGVSALVAALGSESSVVRLAATIGLSRAPVTGVAAHLVAALLEEPTGVSRHMARALSARGDEGFEAAREAAERASGSGAALVLAFGHLAEAGYDLQIEELAHAARGRASEIARRGLDAIIDARDAVALMDGPPESHRDPIDRLAARLEAALQN